MLVKRPGTRHKSQPPLLDGLPWDLAWPPVHIAIDTTGQTALRDHPESSSQVQRFMLPCQISSLHSPRQGPNKTNKTNFPKLLIVAASALVQIEVSAEYCVIRIGETFRSRSTEKPKAVSSAAETRFLQAKKVIFLRKSRTAKVPKV
ncbi:hypothetical protein TESG_08251 [Trichophyton tonsurans CBS 112818]|uniref:Uncharacterized protein n=1 Tax=Trichophyton tonsurans (strain CBS 112818) TaxID=647933 RepID=F2RNJ0_TRIT1|nr:hypothetical protein TESG_08251 [Trichophyton tonsurans CBS 112818]